MGNYIYRAECPKCSCVIKHDTDRSFLNGFFLGSRCKYCGECVRSSYYSYDWVISFGRYVREVKFNILKPSTWFKSEIWEEKQ